MAFLGLKLLKKEAAKAELGRSWYQKEVLKVVDSNKSLITLKETEFNLFLLARLLLKINDLQ